MLDSSIIKEASFFVISKTSGLCRYSTTIPDRKTYVVEHNEIAEFVQKFG